MDSSKRTTYIIAAISFVIIVAAIYFLFVFQKSPKEVKVEESLDELKALTEVELANRPFIALTPTSDGAEIVVSVENMSYFDRIDYEISYLADHPDQEKNRGEKIRRGTTGNITDTKAKKFKNSHLLGTGSKGVRSPDRGIVDAKITMELFRGETGYLAETNFELIQIGTAKSSVSDSLGNFKMEIPGFTKDYWVIVSDTIGLPPQNDKINSQNLVLPIYGTFSVAPDFAQAADLSIKLTNDAADPILYSYSTKDNIWQELESVFDRNFLTITANVNSLSTFVVVSSQ